MRFFREDRLGLLAGVAAFVFAFATLDQVGVVWDEPFFWEKADRIDSWYRQFFRSAVARSEALRPDRLRSAWPFCILPPHENPPVYAIFSHAGWAATSSWLGELRGRRLASALLFSITAGLLTELARRRWGVAPALAAFGAWTLNPRVFTHGRLSTIDMTMTAFWFFAAAAFFIACERRRGVWEFSVFLGLGVMSKFTALIAIPAQLLWSIAYRRGYAFQLFAAAAVLTPLTMIAVHPGWWLDPIGGFRTAVEVHRLRHLFQVVPTYYLGAVYEHALPWHNTLVLTACCIPPVWAALAVVGLIGFVIHGRCDAFVGWAACNWLAMIVVRATPLAPGHDGIRQFLAAFPFFALLAGYGVVVLQRVCGRHGARAALLATVVGWTTAGASWLHMRPLELSYYSEAIGGLPGARRLGLETTYWWDAATPDLLAHLNAQMPPHARIGLSGHFLQVFATYQKLGRLRRDLVFLPLQEWALASPPAVALQKVDYLLILNREGMLKRTDKDFLTPLLHRFQAALNGPVEYAVVCEGVRLLVLVKA